MLKVILCLNVLVAVGGVSGTDDGKVNNLQFVIARNGVPKCAGVAVGKRVFIATAAHCVYGVSKSKLTVTSPTAKKDFKSIKRVIVHPYYNPPSPDYDIALLRMENDIADPGLPLWKEPLPGNAGLKAITLKVTGKEIQLGEQINAALEDRKSCRAKMSGHVLLSSRMLCANIMSDSLPDGRVLLTNNQVLGIGSYYVKGANDILPEIFTNISNSEIYSFIERYTD